MPAPDQPVTLDPLSRLLKTVTYRAARRPERTLLVAGLITAVAVWLAATRLEFRTSRLDLLSASAGYNQRWLAYLDRFGKEDDAVVLVSHNDTTQVSNALMALGQRLESDPELQGVLYRQSVGKLANKSLYLMPEPQLAQIDQLLSGLLQSLTNATSGGVPSGALNLQPLQQSLSSAITQAQTGLDRVKQLVPRDGQLLLEDEGRLGLCLLRMPHADDNPSQVRSQISAINKHLAAMRQSHAEVEFSLTGMPILEWDESQSSQRDMQNATLLSLAGVAVIFVFGFGSWRMPCAAVLCLAIGLCWTVGLATLLVGHLNLFSVAFGAIIAGLGIDYAIHLLSRLQTQSSDVDMSPASADQSFADQAFADQAFTVREPTADELPAALANAVAHCGKGIFTGAVTTAAAFAVAVLTPFRGMTELGVICAAGTLACMVVTIWILPAMLTWQAKRFAPRPANNRPNHDADKRQRPSPWLAVWHAFVLRGLAWSNQTNRQWRLPVLVSSTAFTLLAASQIGSLRYDHNLLNLQADNAPSVKAERELTSRSPQSAWFAVSMAQSPAHARALRKRLEKLSTVARVEEIGSLFGSGALGNDSNNRAGQLVTNCRQHAQQLIESLTAIATQQMALNTSATVMPASFSPALGLEPQFASQIQLLARSITDAAAEPPALADLPASIRTRMASQDGQSFLLRIYAKDDLWQRENLREFVKEIEAVDPRVTGHPVQTWYASGELENSYYQAGIYALLAVMALLMIDFGSLRMVCLALIPVAISAVQLCGWLVALEIPFNAANMIVLPLIIGIGIDDGVHIMHDFAQRGSKSFRLTESTTLALILTSLTTMVGFGSMSIADHRGLQSLGIVLFIGVGLCLWHSWFTLPAMLSYFGPQVERGTRTAIEPMASLQVATNESATTSQIVVDDNEPMVPLLLRDVPILMSLPDYPELSRP